MSDNKSIFTVKEMNSPFFLSEMIKDNDAQCLMLHKMRSNNNEDQYIKSLHAFVPEFVNKIESKDKLKLQKLSEFFTITDEAFYIFALTHISTNKAIVTQMFW